MYITHINECITFWYNSIEEDETFCKWIIQNVFFLSEKTFQVDWFYIYKHLNGWKFIWKFGFSTWLQLYIVIGNLFYEIRIPLFPKLTYMHCWILLVLTPDAFKAIIIKANIFKKLIEFIKLPFHGIKRLYNEY